VNAPEFHEDYHNPDADPCDAQHANFDWPLLYEKLGESSLDIDAERDYKALGQAVASLLRYFIGDELGKQRKAGTAEKAIGRKVIALAWVTNPALLAESPSLAQVARRISIHKSGLSRVTAAATRLFGVRNRAQSHGDGVRK
jgi:hypothetical protein